MISSSKVKVLAVFGVMLMVGSAMCVLAVADDSVAADPKTYTLELTDDVSATDTQAKYAFGSFNAAYTYSNNVGTLTLKNKAEFATTADIAIKCTVDVVIVLENGCDIKVTKTGGKESPYGLYGEKDITIKGSGKLTVDISGSVKDKKNSGVIYTDGDLSISYGTITAIIGCAGRAPTGDPVSFGLHGKDVTIENATITVTDKTGNDSDDKLSPIFSTQTMKIKNSDVTVDIETVKYGINGISKPQNEYNIEIENSTVSVECNNMSNDGSCICVMTGGGIMPKLIIRDSNVHCVTGRTTYSYGIDSSAFEIYNSVVHAESVGGTNSRGINTLGDSPVIYNSKVTLKSGNGNNTCAFGGNSGYDLKDTNITGCKGVFKDDGTEVQKSGGIYQTKYLRSFTIDKDLFRVEYDMNGGTGSAPMISYVDVGSTVTLASAPAKEGREFLGWDDGTDIYEVGSEYTVTKDVVFTAVWGPTVNTDLPEFGSKVSKNTLEIKGVTNGKSVKITVNGIDAGKVDIADTGEFSKTVTLEEGDNVIVVYVDDGAGNVTVRTDVVTYEKETIDAVAGMIGAFAVSILFMLYVGIITSGRI